MSRWLDREEEKPEGSSLLEGLARSGAENRPRTATDLESPKGFGENQRERVLHKDREYHVRPSEFAVLNELGRFRVIDASDLVRGIYGAQMDLALSDFRSLKKQGLVQAVSFQSSRGGLRRVQTLTKEGHSLISARNSGVQQFYWGIVKPAELEHDVLLYRAYLHEEQRLRGDGGTVKQVVLDYELKGKHFSRVNRPNRREPYRKVQEDSARELHLPVIEGHTVFPDLRVEYENERGERSRVDIEVATGNYREKHIGMKAAAGFRVYAERGGGGGFSVDKGQRLRGNVFRAERSSVYPL